MISNNSYSFNFMIINKNIIKINNHEHFETLKFIGDWGLGIGDWAQSPIPNPPSPIPNTQINYILIIFIKKIILNKAIIF